MTTTPNQLHSFPFLKYLVMTVVLFASCSKDKQPSAIEVIDGQGTEAVKINFADVTSESGLGNFRHDNGSFGEMWFPEQMGSGGGFIDYNSDGWVDILLVGGGGSVSYTHLTLPTILLV